MSYSLDPMFARYCTLPTANLKLLELIKCGILEMNFEETPPLRTVLLKSTIESRPLKRAKFSSFTSQSCDVYPYGPGSLAMVNEYKRIRAAYICRKSCRAMLWAACVFQIATVIPSLVSAAPPFGSSVPSWVSLSSLTAST